MEAEGKAMGEGRRAMAEEAAGALARAMKNVSFYESDHPMVTDVLQEVEAELKPLLRAQGEFVVKFDRGYVVLQDRPLVNPERSIGNLVGACHRRGVEALVFQEGVEIEELRKLVEVLAAPPEEVEAEGGVGPALASRGARRVVVERLVSRNEEGGEESPDSASEWRWVYTAALDVLRGAAAEVRVGGAINVASVQLAVNEIVDDVLGDRAIVYNLNSMKDMDEYTFTHALHICILAVELGRELGFGRKRLEELGTATLLHDLGKIFVPLAILRKPSALDEDEFAVVKRHPIDGALVLAQDTSLPPVAAVVAFEHHVHVDLNGYPRMRDRRPLNMYSLMTSIADVYDALTTARPYRAPLAPRTAVGVMREQYAGRLEPRLLKQFLELLGPYPWGTVLRLSDERLLVVTRPNPLDPENPATRGIEVGEGEARLLEGTAPLREAARGAGGLEIVDPYEIGINLAELLHRQHLARGWAGEKVH